ncbi:MAG: inositol-1-monophosphatase [Arsenophonus sp. ER-QC15-MAG3]
MHPMLTIAIRAVRQAGNFITKRYEKPDFVEMMINGQDNFLINFDKKVKQIIIEVIEKSYPTHAIITEEYDKIVDKKKAIQWIINPLDGLINFTKRLPHFSISIAVYSNNSTEIAVIYNPMLNELFTAVRGQGAQLNGYRLRLKNINELNSIIITSSFPFKTKQHSLYYIKIITKLIRKSINFHCTGSIALDLAYVAAGRIDVFFEVNFKPFKFIAGELLIQEAGGIITDFVGGHNYTSSGNIIAGSPYIIKKIYQK